MKTNATLRFRYCLLLLPTATGLFAQNGVTLSNYKAQAGPAGSDTLTIDIRWAPPADSKKVWSDTVWVFADYNNAGTMTRLPLNTSAAKLANPSWSGAKVIEEPGNPNGVWVVGDARTAGAFSATVQMVTTCRDARPCVRTGVCVYAINYPPVGRYTSVEEIHFTGTPPFELKFTDNSSTVVPREEAGHTYIYTLAEGQTLASFTDASRAPGTLLCKPPDHWSWLEASATSYCAGSGVTLEIIYTEPGAVYQLYKDNTLQTGITLVGNGSSMSFTGSFGKGTYTARVLPGVICGALMNGAPVVKDEYPLPANPSVTPGSGCGRDNVELSASLPGAEINWYDVPTEGRLLKYGMSPSTFYTPQLEETRTFYAEAQLTSTGCRSASRTPVTATLHKLPSVTSSTSASRCGAGAVTLSAVASSGATIDWYNSSSVDTLLARASSTYITPSLSATRYYYAQARDLATGCVSSSGQWARATVQRHPAGSTADFTDFDPCTSYTPGARASSWTLIDRRESGNVEWYKVRLMHDGHYWMVQDLKFGNKCYKTGFFGSYDSDQTGKITWLTDETYYGDCRNNPERNAGYLYDWAAAMQRTGAYFNGPEVGCSGIGSKANLCQGICPKGWHIPTGGRSGEFYALHTVAGRNCPGINDYCWNSWSEWEGVLGGLCEAFGPVKYNGLTAYYWSSTYGNSSRAYGLSFGGNPTLPGISALDKSYGYSVRCVRNYVL